MDWVAFEDASQLLEVDGQRPQHRRRAAAELSIELIGELIVPDPASLPERNNEPVSEFGRAHNTLHHGGDQAVAGELQRVIGDTGVLQQVNDRRAVAPVDSRPQGGSLVLGVHSPCVVLRSGLEQWLIRSHIGACAPEGVQRQVRWAKYNAPPPGPRFM